MNHSDICPRCQQRISEERLHLRPLVCDACGFLLSGREASTGQQLERRFLLMMVGLSVAFVLGFMQLISWQSYAVEAIPLQIGQWMHSNTSTQLERLAQIGLDLHKYDLVENVLAQIAQRDSASYARLGKFEMSRGKYTEAADAFRQYFITHNDDLDAHYLYARALGEIGQIDEASKHFEYVLRAKPGVRQVTVLENYVKALSRAGRFDQAKRVIEQARNLDKAAGPFMDTEYKVILERLQGSHS